jgi:hypothetical protein
MRPGEYTGFIVHGNHCCCTVLQSGELREIGELQLTTMNY